jgi:short-subunit dehydrogenase
MDTQASGRAAITGASSEIGAIYAVVRAEERARNVED